MDIIIDLYDHINHHDAKRIAKDFDIILENSDGKIARCFNHVNDKKISMMNLEKIKVFAEKFEWVPLDDLEEFLNKYKL